jgi:hypothetical protein
LRAEYERWLEEQMKEKAPPNAARKEAPGEITVPGMTAARIFCCDVSTRCDAPTLLVTENVIRDLRR